MHAGSLPSREGFPHSSFSLPPSPAAAAAAAVRSSSSSSGSAWAAAAAAAAAAAPRYLRTRFFFEPQLQQQQEEQQQLLLQQGVLGSDSVAAAARGRHSVVCRHWWRGACMRGAACDFLHRVIYLRMPKCRLDGACLDAARGCCVYRHEQQNETVESLIGSDACRLLCSSGSSNYTQQQQQQQQQECLHYFFGYCKQGPRCRKRHTQLNRSLMPAVAPNWFLEAVVANFK
ncbi:hypothetical protein ETH_00018320, partial [Eimeria tenella]